MCDFQARGVLIDEREYFARISTKISHISSGGSCTTFGASAKCNGDINTVIASYDSCFTKRKNAEQQNMNLWA